MRPVSLAIAALLGLAACSEAEPPKPAAAPEPPKPVVLAPTLATPPPPPATAAAPQPSAEELLAERVRRALRDTRKVEGQGVGVRVAGGTVTLYGTAPTADERRRIEAFVAGVEGVQAVVSKLVIVRGS
jgi:hypothetical protein